jgi:hypothetical protein
MKHALMPEIALQQLSHFLVLQLPFHDSIPPNSLRLPQEESFVSFP